MKYKTDARYIYTSYLAFDDRVFGYLNETFFPRKNSVADMLAQRAVRDIYYFLGFRLSLS